MLFCRGQTFIKSPFSKSAFRNAIRESNSLDPDQARQNVGPDLGPNCLQGYQQTKLVGKALIFYFEASVA